MALDPVTVKVLIHMAAQATDREQVWKRIVILIFTPMVVLLILIVFIMYLLTSPLSLFSEWMLSEGELEAIASIQQEYGYHQDIGIYEKDNLEDMGQSLEGEIFTDGDMEVVYYSQLDERWREEMYGTSGTIGQAGCGPTAVAMVISTLTEEVHDPEELAQWSVAHGYRCEGHGSYHSLIPAAASAYGLDCKGDLTAQEVVDALAADNIVIVIMGKGHFTSNGHFIVLRGITREGKILVADPASYERSVQEWEFSVIAEEANKFAGAGGPYWAIGK